MTRNKIVEIDIRQNDDSFVIRFVRGKRGMYTTKQYIIPAYRINRLFWLTLRLSSLCTVRSALLVNGYDARGYSAGVWAVAYVPKRNHK